MKLYIAVLDEFPDFMVPTLVAHATINAHIKFSMRDNGIADYPHYHDWLQNSFKKCVVRVNQKEFDKISQLKGACLQFEIHTLNGRSSCVIVPPVPNDELPKVLKFAKLWKPKDPNPGLEHALEIIDSTEDGDLDYIK